MTAAELSARVRQVQTDSVITLAGEIDLSTVANLRSAVDEALATPPRRMTLDFADVTFCDSQGLSTLIALTRQASAVGCELRLVNVGDFLQQLLDITGLRAALHVEDAET